MPYEIKRTWYVVETHEYRDYPSSVSVLGGPYRTAAGAERAWSRHVRPFRNDADVDIDDDLNLAEIDDGPDGRRSILIAEKREAVKWELTGLKKQRKA